MKIHPPTPSSSPFLWGVSTSGYQSEGGYNNHGEPQNNWSDWEYRRYVMHSGKASSFWDVYKEDFALARSLGVNAFRMSIEWARVQPTHDPKSRREHQWDEKALDHYAEMIRACQRYGLTPLVTLHHFVHPAWLGLDPWLKEENIQLFAEYGSQVIERLNTRLIKYGQNPIQWLITINEPNILVLNQYILGIFPGSLRRGPNYAQHAHRNLIRAHIRTYRLLKELYRKKKWGEVRISYNNFCHDLYWADRVWLDILSAPSRGVTWEGLGPFLRKRCGEFDREFALARLPLEKNPSYFMGMAVRRLQMWWLPRYFKSRFLHPIWEEMQGDDARQFLDYIAFDYYDPFSAHLFRWPVFGDWDFTLLDWRSRIMQAVTSKWWDWRILPQGLGFFLRSYHRSFPGLPIIIAENGMANRQSFENKFFQRNDGVNRSQHLQCHLEEALKARREGVPLAGYFYWSLTDNYEWGSYTPRFGLYGINFREGPERIAIDATGDCPSDTYRHLIAKNSESVDGRLKVISADTRTP